MSHSSFISLLALLAILSGCAATTSHELSPEALERVREEVAASLDAFHQAASDADAKAYLGAFTEAGIFMGTDATERWTLEEFADYCRPYFEKGTGWTFVPIERHISARGELAWADEILTNEKYGTCRGTSVLRDTPDGWKVEHYSLTFLIPNDAVDGALAAVRAWEEQSRSTGN